MSEQNVNNLPAIEDAIVKKLTGEIQKNTLDFIASMRENGFSFDAFDTGDVHSGEVRWSPAYKGESFGCAAVSDCFMFWIGLDWCFDDNELADENLKEFVWSHVVVCPQEKYCKPPYCEGSKNRWKIFRKEYESTCHAPLAFFGPDAIALDNIIKLLLMTKIRNSKGE